jgi:hypothetical protein
MRQALKTGSAASAPSESQVMRKVDVPAAPEPEAPMPATEPEAVVQPVVPPVVPPTPAAPAVREDPRPKVDVEPVTLNTHFAVQILRGESFKDVAHTVLMSADAKGVLFRKLQVLDLCSVGAFSFVRFRSDMADAFEVVRTLTNRGIIVELGGVYMVQFPSGRQGRYPTSTMCSAAKVGFGQVYAGTRIKRWKQQFAA